LPINSIIAQYKDSTEQKIIRKWYSPVSAKTTTNIDNTRVCYSYLLNTPTEQLLQQIENIPSLKIYKMINDPYYTNNVYTGAPTTLPTQSDIIRLKIPGETDIHDDYITIHTNIIGKRDFGKFPGVIARDHSITLQKGVAYDN